MVVTFLMTMMFFLWYMGNYDWISSDLSTYAGDVEVLDLSIEENYSFLMSVCHSLFGMMSLYLSSGNDWIAKAPQQLVYHRSPA